MPGGTASERFCRELKRYRNKYARSSEDLDHILLAIAAIISFFRIITGKILVDHVPRVPPRHRPERDSSLPSRTERMTLFSTRRRAASPIRDHSDGGKDPSTTRIVASASEVAKSSVRTSQTWRILSSLNCASSTFRKRRICSNFQFSLSRYKSRKTSSLARRGISETSSSAYRSCGTKSGSNTLRTKSGREN